MRVSLAVSALVASVAANNYTFPPGFNLNLVDMGARSSWCAAQRNVCPKICDGFAVDNTCDPTTLDFKCVCGDSGPANVEEYIQTVPFFVCMEDFGQCINANERDQMAQEKCKKQKQNNCPTKNATADSASTTTSSASSTAAATMSETATTTLNKGEGSSATSASSSSAATTTTANAAVLLAQEYSTGLLATALFAALRLAL
ncbi:hypothetical protein PHISP_08289 [Aspergillus sp. HF37]|nr:hypothetical protein PHISP_08289 [Aspergillus sp. HF37]